MAPAPADPLSGLPGQATLSQGRWVFAIRPRAAMSTYTVTVETTAASAVSYSSTTLLGYTVYPGPPHHLHFTGVPSSSPAGAFFSVGLLAHDQFNNLLSTGPNLY